MLFIIRELLKGESWAQQLWRKRTENLASRSMANKLHLTSSISGLLIKAFLRALISNAHCTKQGAVSKARWLLQPGCSLPNEQSRCLKGLESEGKKVVKGSLEGRKGSLTSELARALPQAHKLGVNREGLVDFLPCGLGLSSSATKSGVLNSTTFRPAVSGQTLLLGPAQMTDHTLQALILRQTRGLHQGQKPFCSEHEHTVAINVEDAGLELQSFSYQLALFIVAGPVFALCLPYFSQSELRGGVVIQSLHQCGPLSLIDVGSVFTDYVVFVLFALPWVPYHVA
eukprot:1159229-Pelagomonas_calceolata.AAC.6